MAFSVMTERSAKEMEDVATKTRTVEFLSIDISDLHRSKECDIAAAGVSVEPEGIRFDALDLLIPNLELAKSLCLSGQEVDFEPPIQGPPLTKAMAMELHYKVVRGDNTSVQISNPLPLTALSHKGGMKLWVTKMQERVFLHMNPGSTPAASVQILHDIYKHPSKLFGHWKNGMKAIPAESQTFLLMMAYLLRQNPTYLAKLTEREKKAHGKPPATRAMVKRTLEKALETSMVRSLDADLEAAATSKTSGDAHEESGIGEATDPGEGDMYNEVWIKDLLRRTEEPPPDPESHDLFHEFREAVIAGSREVTRLRTAEQQTSDELTKATGEKEELSAEFKVETRKWDDKVRQLEESLRGKDAEIISSNARSEELNEQLTAMGKEQEEVISKLEEEFEQVKAKIVREKLTAMGKQHEEVVSKLEEEFEQERAKFVHEAAAAAQTTEEISSAKGAVDAELAQLKLALEESDQKVAVYEGERNGVKTALEEAQTDAHFWKTKSLNDDYWKKISRTPEQTQLLRSSKKRKLRSPGLSISNDDINKLTDKLEERVKEELQKELAELHAYRSLVEQTAKEQFSMATTLLQPRDVTAEGYYQVMNLLVDSYRVAMGIAPIKLSNDQWVKLLEGLPREGKEILPRMLWEQRLQAEHPEVCNVLLGGLFNLHACHLMSAQEWAMDTHQRAAAKIIMLQQAQPIPGEEIGRWNGLAAGTRNEVQQRRGHISNFLDRVDEAEARKTQIIGARRMRWVFREAGWDAKGQLECPPLDNLVVPEWAIHYEEDPPERYVAELFPMTGPDPHSLRFVSKELDLGQFKDHDTLVNELEQENSPSWAYGGPTEELLRWVEDVQGATALNLSHFGREIPPEMCLKRRAKQAVLKDQKFRNEFSGSPSIYAGGRRNYPILPVDPYTGGEQTELQLRAYYTSFHTGGLKHGGLKDPRLLISYVVTRGLATIMRYPWRDDLKLENFTIYEGVSAGGWTFYKAACYFGPLMVRWLKWVGSTGYFPGLHAIFVGPIKDAYLAYIMLETRSIYLRANIGFHPTALNGGNHHKNPRPPLPPRRAVRPVRNDAHPAELLPNEKDLWTKIFRSQGQDAAVDAIQSSRNTTDYARFHAICVELNKRDDECIKRGAEIAKRVVRRPQDDKAYEQAQKKNNDGGYSDVERG